MNNTEKIFEMLGIEPIEVFKADFTGEVKEYFLDYDLYLHDINDSILSPKRSLSIISGEIPIIKKPWKPKNGENYWFVAIDGDIICTRFSPDYLSDIGNLLLGNHFKTEEEAFNSKDLMLAKINEVLK